MPLYDPYCRESSRQEISDGLKKIEVHQSSSEGKALLRLQSWNLNRVMFYADLFVCISYIAFLTQAVRLGEYYTNNSLIFYIILMISILFFLGYIGIHLSGYSQLTPIRESELFSSRSWRKYCLQVEDLPFKIKSYVVVLMVLLSTFFLPVQKATAIYILWITLSTFLFLYGIFIINRVILLKRNTQYFIERLNARYP